MGLTVAGNNEATNRFVNQIPKWIGILAIVMIICGTVLVVTRRTTVNTASNAADQSISEAETKPESNSSEIQEEESKIPPNVSIPNEAVVYDGHSYYIFDNKNSWEQAREYCKSRGGYLAVINNRGEDDFLYEYMLDSGLYQVFFGFSDAVTENDWKWVSEGLKSGRSDYLNWGTNDEGEKEPNKDSNYENYAQLDTNMITGRWNDCMFGQDTTSYICEWDYVQ